MSLGLTARLLQRFLRLSPEEKAKRLAEMSFDDLLSLDAAFELWAHPSQLPPGGGGWRTWLMMAGRGFGKTRAGAEWVHELAQPGARRIALVAASIDEARKVMVEGVSGLLAIARNHKVKLNWEPSLNQLSWPKGSVATLFSGESPDGMRGPEHHFAWCFAEDRYVALPGGSRSSLGKPGARPRSWKLLSGGRRCDGRLVRTGWIAGLFQ